MSTEGAPEPVSRARSHIIERPRLTKLLDESKARILLLVAPAGYGKTTLARQWCERSHITSTWFWARPASVDLAVLATGIAQACARIVDDAGQRMRDRLLTSPSPDDEPHDIAELLAADLPDWPIDAWLVIDDYHHLAKSRAAEAFIETLVDLAPLRTLVTTRQRPSWLSGRDLVYGDAFELDQAPLTFTRREATGILRRALKSESIVQSARGWPAVIGMAALSPETQRPLDALPSTLYDFFAEELYGSTALKLQRQLCLFAAARTSNPLAAELAFKPEDLTDAAHAGFLTISRDRIDLHPLLADFLGDKAATAQTLRDDLESFARLLISKSLWDEAFSVFAHLKNSDLLLDLFETAIQPMLAEGRLVALESWISSARDYHVGGPLVDRAEAELAYRQGNYRIGETLALRAAQKASDSDVVARSYLVAARCAHLLGRGKEANEYYLRLQSLSDDDSLVRTGLWGKFVVSLELNPVEAAATLEQLRSLPVRDSTDLVQVLGGALDLGRRFSGLSEATLESEVGEALLDEVRDPLVKTHFLNARAGALVALGVYDEATTTAKKELAEALAYRLRFVLPHAFIHLSNALLGLRRFAEAEDASKKASNAARKARDRYSEFNAIAVRARLLIARAQYQEAVGLLDVDLTNVPMAALREECRATRALALAAGGRLDESISLCESPREVFDLQAELLRAFAKAIVSMQLDKSSGDSDAQSAFEASATSGYFDSCVLAYRAFPPLLTRLVGIESIVNRLRPLLEAAHDFELARLAGLDISLDSGSPLSGLSRREMEVLNLLVEGLTNREIAQRLFIQESTAKVHVRHILAKLSVRTRTEAALLGSRYGA